MENVIEEEFRLESDTSGSFDETISNFMLADIEEREPVEI